jgi:hypothetical protein
MLEVLLSAHGQPRIRLALAAAYSDTFVIRLLGRERRIPLEAVLMAHRQMFVHTSKREAEFGFRAGSVEVALDPAVS